MKTGMFPLSQKVLDKIKEGYWHHLLLYFQEEAVIAEYVDGKQVSYKPYLSHFRVQYSNKFNAKPNVKLSDTITVPTTSSNSSSLILDGSSNYISLPVFNKLSSSTNKNWTVDFWVKFNQEKCKKTFSLKNNYAATVIFSKHLTYYAKN